MVFIQQTVYLKYINIDKYKLIGLPYDNKF